MERAKTNQPEDVLREEGNAIQIVQAMSDDGDLEVITIGNPIENTPDGMHLMDRVRQKHRDMEDQLREAGGEEAVELLHRLEADFERKVLFGDGA